MSRRPVSEELLTKRKVPQVIAVSIGGVHWTYIFIRVLVIGLQRLRFGRTTAKFQSCGKPESQFELHGSQTLRQV